MSDLTHEPCPYVDCGSTDAFSWNEEGYGFCHSGGCNRSYPMKNMPEVFDWAREVYPLKEKIDAKKVKPTKSTFTDIRGLDEDVARLYSIQVQTLDDGTPVRYAFKYPSTVKYRDYNDKKNSWYRDLGKGGSELFGPDFNAGTSNRLYITEGEFDAASLYQILGKTFPVVSVPSSSIGKKFFQVNESYLKSFNEIVYAGELSDEAGRKCADKFYQVFPDKFYFVSMTKHKDANDFLTNGDAEDLKWAAKKPQRYSPENFYIGEDAVFDAITTENPYEYVPTGHSGIDEVCRGLVRGGLTFIKAPRGTGKTEVIRYLETSLLKSESAVFAGVHMEEMRSTTYRSMASYLLNKNVRTKEDAEDSGVSEDEVIKAAQEAIKGDRTILFEMRSGDDPLMLLDHVRTAATIYGAHYIFIDHVQRLAYLSSNGVDAATSTLTTLAARMAQLAKELNIGVIFISQVNDDGRTKYAASLEEEAIICLSLSRDGEAEDEIERNTTYITVQKNRPFAKMGSAGSFYYDSETSVLREFY